MHGVSSTSKLDTRVRAIVEPSLLGLAALAFVALARYHWQYVADDAFIAFRYARNLVAGLGPVWNPGEAVEGFSSPLWLGLLAAGGLVGFSLPGWAGGLGVAFLALCLVFVHRTCAGLRQSRLAAAVACFATALIYPLHYWASAGLETALFAALITATVWSLLASSPHAWVPVAACLGVARPEGPFLVVALLGLVVLAHGRDSLRAHRLAVALAPMLLWLLFRRFFYGDWLPNPYYAKATGALLPRIEAGLIYSLWALLAWLVTATAAWLADAFDRRVLAALAFLAVVLALVVGEGGDWMWHARMVVPVLPALVAVAVGAIGHARLRRRFVATLACVLAWSAFAPKANLLVDALGGGRLPPSSFQEGTLKEASSAAARYIADHYSPKELVAVNHAGAVPFALQNPALDMTGLTDRHIAHEREGAVHGKFDPAYVLSRRPDLVVLNSATRPGSDGVWYHPGYWDGETALVAQPGWEEWYRPVDRFWEWRWVGDVPRYVVLFERVSR
jgi:arabinofuranosyltransferase